MPDLTFFLQRITSKAVTLLWLLEISAITSPRITYRPVMQLLPNLSLLRCPLEASGGRPAKVGSSMAKDLHITGEIDATDERSS